MFLNPDKPMRDQLQHRLQALKAEFDTGQKKLASLEDEAQQLRHLLLRISGGIQVLEEELAKFEPAAE
jgi:predicted  nucleic acid-binding Zn-ribbon protein